MVAVVWPAGHGVQLAGRGALIVPPAEYVPTGHARHVLPFQIVPGSHTYTLQLLALMLPLLGVVMPVLHAVHVGRGTSRSPPAE